MGTVHNKIHLYFHSHCFDGAASAAIASDYFEQVRGYSKISLHGVNYHLKDRWLATELERPCAIVDFLYHTAADFWVDHHPTAFLNDETRQHYENRSEQDIFYDGQASSCSKLIWERWGAMLSPQPAHYEELVKWADRIDSARYESVEETIRLEAPPLQINLALAVSRTKAFNQQLVHLFRKQPLSEIAAQPEVHKKFEKGRALHKQGLQRLKTAVHQTENGIVVFDVNGDDVLVNRYAPFYFYPHARYSAGIVRTGGKAKLTTMRNPWLEFPCAPLGQLCTPLGGGGHQRVGSVLLQDQDPKTVLSKLLDGITAWENNQSKGDI
jgi:hypothetical protein